MTRATPLSSDAPRYFGRFELRQQLGQSIASQVWVVLDSHLQHEAVLCVPRVQPLNEAERELWMQEVQLGARLKQVPGLQTDYIDLYWMHVWDRITPPEEVLQTLTNAVRAGRSAFLGGAMSPQDSAQPSTPVLGTPFWHHG